MGGITDYDRYDGIGLAELVKKKETTVDELVAEARRRIDRLNPKLNAVIHVLETPACLSAVEPRCPDGPFEGVPFLLKDVHHALAGTPMSCGCAGMKRYIPAADAEIVIRFKRAGVAIVGKTNTPEFKLGAVTEPAAFGPTRNPWNPDYSCGGSSGGSAAAVAAGIVPLASGTDEGGSIRIPASYCGLFGLKPSRGRNPVGPEFDNEWGGVSTSHVITRSVRDSAAMLDATAGLETGSPYGFGRQDRSFLDDVSIAPGQLMIAVHQPTAYGESVDAECGRAVEATAALLEGLGHIVEPADPGFDQEEVNLLWCTTAIGQLTATLDSLVEQGVLARSLSGLELQNRTMAAFGRRLRAIDYIRATNRFRHLGRLMGRFMRKYDLVLMPVLAKPPVKVGSQEPSRQDRFSMRLILSWLGGLMARSQHITDFLMNELVRNAMKGQQPLTMIANLTGQPAMSVPLHWLSDGLPCGVQFIGRYGDESTLFRLAGQLEAAAPWFDKRPVMSELAL